MPRSLVLAASFFTLCICWSLFRYLSWRIVVEDSPGILKNSYKANASEPDWEPDVVKTVRDAEHGNSTSLPDRDCSRRKFRQVDCSPLENSYFLPYLKNWRPRDRPRESELLQWVSQPGCPLLHRRYCLPSAPLSSEEKDFPLAYVVIVNQNAEQILQLLENVYLPQNSYCVTFDTKADATLKTFVERLVANCGLANLIVPDRHEFILWGGITVLKAAINCLSALKRHSQRSETPWKYAQILSWSDVPLKTNLEMVEIFKILNGSSDSELKWGQKERYLYQVEYSPNSLDNIPTHWDKRYTAPGFPGTYYKNFFKPKGPPPNGISTIFKGSFAASLSNAFVSWMLTAPTPREYLKWLEDTYIPDEHYWATLLHNPNIGAPGYFPGKCAGGRFKPWISRYQSWPGDPCDGKRVRGSCVFGIKDVPRLKSRPHLVAHKFCVQFEPAAMYCLSKWHHEKTYSKQRLQNPHDYRQLAGVMYHNLPQKKKESFTCPWRWNSIFEFLTG